MYPSSSSSLACSSSKRKRSYDEPIFNENDVFLNYSFEDIGNSFIRHLQAALKRNSFIISDHNLLPHGQDTCLELLKAIQESEIFVLVFSINYSSSLSCLDELVHIMDCFHKFEDRKVLPVFFKVEPSDVRSQQGPFMKAFQAHMNNIDIDPERVKKWKQALKDAGKLSGLTMENEDEAEFLQKIVEELQQMQSPEELHVTEHHVGLGSRAEKLISTLRLDLKERVLVVAVFGISGIGKTTIVKETYNRIAKKFNFRCFLSNIDDFCHVPNWKVVLPNELISCLTRNDKFSIIRSHNDSVTKIRRLVSRQKVLLVLDDVDNFQQLEAIGINPAWFYKGSRIIVTTRNRQSLGNIPYESYHTMLLNRRESLNLFMRLMFTRNEAVNTNFIKQVVSLAGGLPLVIKVWSRHFVTCGKEEWESELEELKRIPHNDVHQQLKKSYDSLTNRAKKLFLDIVCFFHWTVRFDWPVYGGDWPVYGGNDLQNLVVKVLQDEETAFFPNKEIRSLIDRSLAEKSDLSMPHAIRVMGEEIVRQENEDEPGQRSRLCDERVVMRVLTECSGTESVENIMLMRKENDEVTVQLKVLRKMCNLRLLCFRNTFRISWSNCSHDEMPFLSFKRLKYMEWDNFPFKSIDHVDMGNVVVLRLRRSKLEILWEGMKSLKKLRILDVSYSDNLIMTGDFYGLENLEELSFQGCVNLQEIHDSISCLHKVAIMNLISCIALKRIPWEMIVKLPSLGALHLSQANGLETEEVTHYMNFHFRFQSLKKLRILDLSYSDDLIMNGILDVSYSDNLIMNGDFYVLENLKKLSFEGCVNLQEMHDSISCLDKVAIMNLISCITLKRIPWEMIVKLPSLGALHLGHANGLETEEVTHPFLDFLREPVSLLQLHNLNEIEFYLNKKHWIPNLPRNITSLKVNNCGSPRNLPPNINELKSLEFLYIFYCPTLGIEDPRYLIKLTGLTNLRLLAMFGCGLSQVPSEIGNLVSLKELDLSYNTFSSLPDKLSNLSQLVFLGIHNCCELRLLPLLPTNLETIEAGRCCSLDMMPFDSMQRSFIFRSKLCKESTFPKALLINLPQKKGILGWCSYRKRGDVLSFVAPMHMDKKLCGIIFYAKSTRRHTPKIFNKTKNTSQCLKEMCSMGVMLYPLDHTTLVVEAGDTIALQFDPKLVSRCGLHLVYDSDVVDSKLVIQNVNDFSDDQINDDYDSDCDDYHCCHC